MTADQWERLNRVFHAALRLTPGERTGFISRECADDADVHRRVARLIDAHESAGPFLHEPAFASISPGAEPGRTLDGTQLGAYRILRQIGRGGMGAVYLAERADGEYEQLVAIKLIRRGMDLETVLQRFRAERQILASLQHPHIARLLDGGTTDDGEPYFVMEYIDGVPVTEFAALRQLSIAGRLRVFLRICEAVSYAHERQVIHRDIKPANVLVTDDGIPRLLDFGIAKTLDDGLAGPAAVTGFQLLTPEYASPEQIDGRTATVQSDVYSLGVVLYELLAGASPYGRVRAHPLHVTEAVRTAAAPRPSSVATDPATRSQLLGDLDTIVLAAIRKEPERRYQTVGELAADIRRYLEAEPIAARRDSSLYRGRRFLRRNTTTLAASSVTAAMLLGSGFIGLTAGGDHVVEPLVALASRGDVALFEKGGGPLLVGPILSAVPGEQDSVARVIPLILNDAVSRVHGATTVDRLRILELHARLGTTPDDTGAAHAVARLAGARTLLTGVLTADPRAGYRLRIRMTRADDGSEVRSFETRGRDAVELARHVSRTIVGPRRAIPDANLTRHREWLLRDSALRILAGGETRTAHALFLQAAARDTTDGIAWFHAQATLESVSADAPRELLRHAVAAVASATPSERLRILFEWSSAMGLPSLAQLADSLLTREPANPRALRLWAYTRADAGDYGEAIPKLWAAFRLDSAVRARSPAACHECTALEELVAVYTEADSAASALRAARLLTQLQPDEVRHWLSAARLASRVGRDGEAAAAAERAREVAPGRGYAVDLEGAIAAVERERYPVADAQLRRLLTAAENSDERIEALWWLAVSLRQQGRVREAIEVMRAARPDSDELSLREAILLHKGQLQFEARNWRLAAQAFDSAAQMARVLRDSPPAYVGNRAWRLMHVARASAEMGDTSALARLTDSVRNLGGMSGTGRNKRLHHYLRGKLLAARGDSAGAIAAYRSSIRSSSFGFTRANYDLARLLLAAGEPSEAIRQLEAALRGGRDASNLYVTATELHELLAVAYETIGEHARAVTHHRAVVRAWSGADPHLRARAVHARRRAERLASR